MAAAVVEDEHAIIDTKLYWASCSSRDEAMYLCAVLNAPVVTSRTAPLQWRGLFGTRDLHKYVCVLPIPTFTGSPLQRELADLCARAEGIAAAVPLGESIRFTTARSRVRAALLADGLTAMIDLVVTRLLDDAHK